LLSFNKKRSKMNYYTIPAALFIAFIITLLFSIFSKRPFRGLWIFFLILFLVTLSGQLWISPFGPTTYGITWVPLIFTPLFFIFLILALIPPIDIKDNKGRTTPDGAFIALGLFFWVMIILLILAIALGYYRTYM